MNRRFVIPGAPQGKARPRVVHQGGRAHSYTPEKTIRYEALTASCYKAAYPGADLLDGPVSVIIRAHFPIPGSWPKSKKAAALAELIQPTVKADADNIAKIIADSLNGIAWIDDKQITHLEVSKRYSAVPRVEVEIWSMDGGTADGNKT